jgi:hypothetical protein
MKSITTSADIKMAIQELELQQGRELFLLKEELKRTTEGLKPINIIKTALKNAVTSPDIKTDVFKAAIGLTTGILAKKLVIGKTFNPFKKIFGIILEMAVANKVVKNADEIKSTGSILFNTFFRKKEQSAKP